MEAPYESLIKKGWEFRDGSWYAPVSIENMDDDPLVKLILELEVWG